LETVKNHVVVAGAGIVGVSTAIWLCRAGHRVTLVDRQAPGEATSFGNAGLLANAAVVPVTMPGTISKSPKMLLDPDFPLFLRWSYLPRLLQWLLRFLSNANDADTRRIAAETAKLTFDSVQQHAALAKGTAASGFLVNSDYCFSYRDKADFDKDSFSWGLRDEHGFVPTVLQGRDVQDFEPMLSHDIGLLAVLPDHGYVRDPGGYVKALAAEAEAKGAAFRRAEVNDFTFTDGQVSAVETDQGPIPCDRLVLATGAWSKPLAQKLGLKIPLESERGYHLMLRDPSHLPRNPIMITSGKFVATPMAGGLRCAGIVELGGTDAGPSAAPAALLERQVRATFPDLVFSQADTWMGHRPTLPDSLPMIGEIAATGVFTAFGHQHVGLTCGPKTGRIVSDMISAGGSNMDVTAYSPHRFGG
jgi:D-amino-acid dehydrogenase